MYLQLQLVRIVIGSHIAVHCSTRALGGTNNGNEICIGDAFRNRTKKLTRLFLLLLQLLMLLLLLWLCHGKSRMCMVAVYVYTHSLAPIRTGNASECLPWDFFVSLVDVTVFLAYLINCKDTERALINIYIIYNALINIYNMSVNRFMASYALRGNEANIFALI